MPANPAWPRLTCPAKPTRITSPITDRPLMKISAPITAYNGYVFGVLQEEGADAQILSVRW